MRSLRRSEQPSSPWWSFRELSIPLLTNSRTSKWSTKGSSSNISSIHTCRYFSLHAGYYHVLRRSFGLRYLHLHEEERSWDLQDAHAWREIQGQGNRVQQIPIGYPRYQRSCNLDSAIRRLELCGRICLSDDERWFHCDHLYLFDGLPQHEGSEESGRW